MLDYLKYIHKIEKLRACACWLFFFLSFFFFFFFFPKDFETIYSLDRMRKEETFGQRRIQTHKTLQGSGTPPDAFLRTSLEISQ